MLRKKKSRQIERERRNECGQVERQATESIKRKVKKTCEKKNNEQNIDPILFSFFRFLVQTNFDAVYVEKCLSVIEFFCCSKKNSHTKK
jgi:hypothetical protein